MLVCYKNADKILYCMYSFAWNLSFWLSLCSKQDNSKWNTPTTKRLPWYTDSNTYCSFSYTHSTRQKADCLDYTTKAAILKKAKRKELHREASLASGRKRTLWKNVFTVDVDGSSDVIWPLWTLIKTSFFFHVDPTAFGFGTAQTQ